jgi:hypothetical protein
MNFKKDLYLGYLNVILNSNIQKIYNEEFIKCVFENNTMSDVEKNNKLVEIFSICYINGVDCDSIDSYAPCHEQFYILYNLCDYQLKIQMLSLFINKHMNDEQLEKLHKFKPTLNVNKTTTNEFNESKSSNELDKLNKSNSSNESDIVPASYLSVSKKPAKVLPNKQNDEEFKVVTKKTKKNIKSNSDSQFEKDYFKVYTKTESDSELKSIYITSFLFNSIHDLNNYHSNKIIFTEKEINYVCSIKYKFKVNLSNEEKSEHMICTHSYYSDCQSSKCQNKGNINHLCQFDKKQVNKYLTNGKYDVKFSSWEKAFDICSRIYNNN